MADWDRISKLLRMFASDQPGEVAASAAALVRVLASDNLTLNDVADRLLAVDTLQVALNNACRDIERLRAEVASARQAAMQTQYYNVYPAAPRSMEDSTTSDETSTIQPTPHATWFDHILRREPRK